VRGGLLDEDVLAGLAGPDAYEGVPVVGGGIDDYVDILVVEQLPDISEDIDFFVSLVAFFDDGVEIGGIDVAEGDDSNAGHLSEGFEVAPALAPDFDERAQADHSDANVVIGTQDSGMGQGDCGGGCQRAFEEISSFHLSGSLIRTQAHFVKGILA